MKIVRTVLYVALGVAALFAFGRFFLSQLGSGRSDELAAVVLAPPPGYAVVERGEIPPAEAAAELAEQVERAGSGKVGVRFVRRGATVYWLADVAGDRIEERAAGASGTRVQTVWRGGLRERLRWGRIHGDFGAPGLPGAERANLYH